MRIEVRQTWRKRWQIRMGPQCSDCKVLLLVANRYLKSHRVRLHPCLLGVVRVHKSDICLYRLQFLLPLIAWTGSVFNKIVQFSHPVVKAL